MCSDTRGAIPVNRCTAAASSIFSCGVRGTPSCANTLNRVPEFPYAHDGVSMRWARNAARTAALSIMDTPEGILEVVVVDVVGVERRRWAEDHLAVLAYRAIAELARLELLALGAGDLARRERRRRVRRQVAQLARVPQRELGHRAVLDELAHLVRRAQPGQLHLSLVRRGRQVPRRGRDAHRGRRDDALQIRVLLQQRLSLLERLLVVVVPVYRRQQLDLRVLRLLQLVLHKVDPGVLVRRVRGRGEDRDLARAADL